MASPTVFLEGLITSLAVAGFEGRHVYSFDVPGAFLQAELPEDKLLLLRLNGEFVDVMCKVNPEHQKNIIIDKNGKKILYMKVVRALYGCIEAALAWYNLFSETLQEEGFILNAYDKCVANKTVKGAQCTIIWHVDDCVVSHADKTVLDDFTNRMMERFGKMEINTTSIHNFLGMKIKFTSDKKVEIDMTKQVDDLINDFEQENEVILDENVSSPTFSTVKVVGKQRKMTIYQKSRNV